MFNRFRHRPSAAVDQCIKELSFDRKGHLHIDSMDGRSVRAELPVAGKLLWALSSADRSGCTG